MPSDTIPALIHERARTLIDHIRAGGEVAVVSRYDDTGHEQFYLASATRPDGIRVVVTLLEIGLPVADLIAPPTVGSRN
jgi:hypothetical protein